ncbi:hypothetical protein [Streptomyces nigrescens]|uniref:hypothetical protein n=1 Tax=Streptomyces nigrescens TaxID=1920 RepID=UPI0036C12C4E
MNAAILDPGACLVIAEVIHGPHATPVVGEGLFCSIECAADGVRELTASLAEREEGAAFALSRGGRVFGFVATGGGQLWGVRAYGSHELRTDG